MKGGTFNQVECLGIKWIFLAVFSQIYYENWEKAMKILQLHQNGTTDNVGNKQNVVDENIITKKKPNTLYQQ